MLRNAAVFCFVVICSMVCAQSAPTKTQLTPDNRLLLNGKPHFFIGTAPGPDLNLKTPEGTDGWAELSSGGIDVVRGTPALNDTSSNTLQENKAYFDKAIANNIYVWPFLYHIVERDNETARQNLKTIIQTFKNHPAVFFWKFSDEPEWGKVPIAPLVKSYNMVRELDRDHLIWITHAPRGTTETLQPYSAACDVLALDIYPIPSNKHAPQHPNKGLSIVGDYTKQMVHLAENKRLVFMILQVFWSGVNTKRNPKNFEVFPTFKEERYMTYQAIINGSNSLSYFGLAMQPDPEGKDQDKKLGCNWKYWRSVLKPLLTEIKKGSELYPALVAPDSKVPVRFSGAPQIEVRCKQTEDALWIMAAAREGATQKVTFAGIPTGAIKVVYENRNLQSSNGSFSDTFAEHDVHIYRIAMSQPAP